ncbi:esterase, partial [Rhizobium ruizarguesonis]
RLVSYRRADSPEIVRLLGRRLAGKSLEGGKASVADQIGMTADNFAGSAARVAVADPVAVISPEAREILKRELSSNGGKMVDGQIAY